MPSSRNLWTWRAATTLALDAPLSRERVWKDVLSPVRQFDLLATELLAAEIDHAQAPPRAVRHFPWQQRQEAYRFCSILRVAFGAGARRKTPRGEPERDTGHRGRIWARQWGGSFAVSQDVAAISFNISASTFGFGSPSAVAINSFGTRRIKGRISA
jgi:hypothetical protein